MNWGIRIPFDAYRNKLNSLAKRLGISEAEIKNFNSFSPELKKRLVKMNPHRISALDRGNTGILSLLLLRHFKSEIEKRNIDFYCSRNKDLSLDKSRFLKKFKELYGIPIKNMAFIGDDFFDLSIIKKLRYTYCPSNSPQIVKDNCRETLKVKGGEGVVAYLYDLLLSKNKIKDASEEKVNELDKKETASQEMS